MATSENKENASNTDFLRQYMCSGGGFNVNRLLLNLQRNFYALLIDPSKQKVNNNIFKEFATITAELAHARVHHKHFEKPRKPPGDLTTVINCKECSERILRRVALAADTLCEQLIVMREQAPDNPQTQWDIKNICFPEENPSTGVRCCGTEYGDHQTNDLQYSESPKTQPKIPPKPTKPIKRDPSPTPSRGSNSSRLTSRSNSLGSISATPRTPKKKKKATRSPPSGRRYEPNPPSLIFTKVRDQRLLGTRRSHFKRAWEDALQTAFGNDIPDKMSFKNIDEIVCRHSAITISFLERPKQSTLKSLVRKLRNLSWGQANLFVPNYRHESPWQPTQPPRQQTFSWNEPRPVRNAWTQRPSPINKLNFASPPDRTQPPPQRTPINEFARRSFYPPPYPSHFESPPQQYQHDQRLHWRMTNLESKLDELLKRLSYA